MQTIPAHGITTPRNTIPAMYKWDTSDLYPDLTAWQTSAAALKADLPKLTRLKGRLSDTVCLKQALVLRDHFSETISRLYAYARLQQDVDNGNTSCQALTGQAENLLNTFEQAVSFLDAELTALPEKYHQSLLQDANFSTWHFVLANLFRLAAHVLPPEQETLISQSHLATDTGAAAFRALVSADMKFPVIKDGQGQDQLVSEGSYLLNMTDQDRVLRQNSFTGLMKTYHQYRNTLATTLTGACRSAKFYAGAAKYPDTLTAILDEDNIPVSLYDNLLQTIHDHLKPLHEYMQLKKEVLGYEELHPYDIYLPLTRTADTFAYTYEESCKHICQALAPLGKAYVKALQEGFSHHWIDIYENQGKRSGAYSCGVFGVHPYVLLNYQPRYNSMSTIAHEMGHALHSYFTNQTQPYATSDYSIFCAEVASTTNESLLLEATLKQANKEQKIYLLNQFLEAVRTTVYRQVQFAEFEKYIHGKINAGESLQADDLDEYWRQSNHTYYGPALTVDEELGSEWSRIPHFYTPFYVYKYATGYTAATFFAQKILAQEPGAVDKYLAFLHSGASDYSLNLLKNAGIDLMTPAPYEVTLNKFAAKLAELKQLMGQ